MLQQQITPKKISVTLFKLLVLRELTVSLPHVSSHFRTQAEETSISWDIVESRGRGDEGWKNYSSIKASIYGH